MCVVYSSRSYRITDDTQLFFSAELLVQGEYALVKLPADALIFLFSSCELMRCTSDIQNDGLLRPDWLDMMPKSGYSNTLNWDFLYLVYS
jgi:hypothetical protein